MEMNEVGQARLIIHEVSHLAASAHDHFYYSMHFHSNHSKRAINHQINQLTETVRERHDEIKIGSDGHRPSAFTLLGNADTLGAYPLLKYNEFQNKDDIRKTLLHERTMNKIAGTLRK